jgi:hypothetical protein
MQLTDEDIMEFQELYKKHFGKDLGKDEALAKGIQLIRLLEVVLKNSQPEPVPNAGPVAQ